MKRKKPAPSYVPQFPPASKCFWVVLSLLPGTANAAQVRVAFNNTEIEQAKQEIAALGHYLYAIRIVDVSHGCGLPERASSSSPAYEVVGTTYDGVEVLAPATKSERFTTEEVREAIREALPSSGSAGRA